MQTNVKQQNQPIKRSPQRFTHTSFVNRLNRSGKPLPKHKRSLIQAAKSEASTEAENEGQATRLLAVSGVGLTLAALGATAAPVFSLASIPVQLYTMYPLIRAGYHDLKDERRLTAAAIDLVVMPGILGAGYFFASATAIFLLNGSSVLVQKTETASQQQLDNLFGEQPQTVWLLTNGVEVECSIDQIEQGDIAVVHAGQVIPVDGVVVDGVGSVDQRMLTGESQPTEVEAGATVFSTTLLLSGTLHVRVEQAGTETVAARIGTILSQTADFKQTLQSRGTKLANRFAPYTAAFATLALPVAGVGGLLSILYAGGLGYNMRIIAPISMLNHLRQAAQNGILIKDARSFDLLSDIDTIVFDKTGTLTLEQPHLVNIETYTDIGEDVLLQWAAAAEYKQTHPVARAILQAATERGLTLPDIAQASYEVGYGIRVTISKPNKTILVGSDRFMRMEGIALDQAVEDYQAMCQANGHSLVMVAVDGALAGAFELKPTVRPEAPAMLHELHGRGLKTVIISGDQELPTRNLAEQLGIDTYFANTLPENKGELIEQLQQDGRRVCFIGDGINDTIALKKADVSISMQGATTAATDTAQIVLLNGDLSHITTLLDISQAFENNMQANLATSVLPAGVCIGGVLVLHIGILPAVMIYNTGLAAGLTNSMLPMLREERFSEVAADE